MIPLKSFFIRTYGCQMNELDSDILASELKKQGLLHIENEDEADLLLFNTCSIRDLAERKVMGKLGQLAREKRKGQIIGLAGCMAVAKKEKLFQKFPHLDFLLGTQNLSDLSDVLKEVLQTKKQVMRCCERNEEEPIDYTSIQRENSTKALVSIIRGCSKFCTYCVVPYTRGKELSRNPESIIEECKRLAEKGYKEIFLLGQNVNSYGKDFSGKNFLFHDLLYAIDKIQDLKRVRFLTSHPVDITIELMQAMRDLPSLCEFLHFPLQAGSDRILHKMNRNYSKAEYFEKVDRLRSFVPNIALGTDIIVGFPTETHEEFLETCEAFSKVHCSVAFLFAYSARKGTPAFRWKDDVAQEIKEERLQHLLSLYRKICEKERKKMIASTVEVLVEGMNKEGKLKGRTRCWKKVIFDGPSTLIGTLQQIYLESCHYETLMGKITSPKS